MESLIMLIAGMFSRVVAFGIIAGLFCLAMYTFGGVMTLCCSEPKPRVNQEAQEIILEWKRLNATSK